MIGFAIVTLLLIVIIFLSITFHEYAHGWAAYKLGDPTPKTSGRLTINPLAHIDPWGTVALPILILLLSSRFGYPFIIGYAKPIPINPYHFKNPKKDLKWVGLAGPSANLLIAIFLSLIWRLKIPFLSEILVWAIFLNLILAVFNLLPIPPLDGSRIVTSFLPNQAAYKYLKIEPYGFFIVIALVMTGFFKWFIVPLVLSMLRLLGVELPA